MTRTEIFRIHLLTVVKGDRENRAVRELAGTHVDTEALVSQKVEEAAVLPYDRHRLDGRTFVAQLLKLAARVALADATVGSRANADDEARGTAHETGKAYRRRRHVAPPPRCLGDGPALSAIRLYDLDFRVLFSLASFHADADASLSWIQSRNALFDGVQHAGRVPFPRGDPHQLVAIAAGWPDHLAAQPVDEPLAMRHVIDAPCRSRPRCLDRSLGEARRRCRGVLLRGTWISASSDTQVCQCLVRRGVASPGRWVRSPIQEVPDDRERGGVDTIPVQPPVLRPVATVLEGLAPEERVKERGRERVEVIGGACGATLGSRRRAVQMRTGRRGDAPDPSDQVVVGQDDLAVREDQIARTDIPVDQAVAVQHIQGPAEFAQPIQYSGFRCAFGALLGEQAE